MAAPINLRADFDGTVCDELLGRARTAARSGGSYVGSDYDCGSRGEAARIGGVDLQIVWDWVGGPMCVAQMFDDGKVPCFAAVQREAEVCVTPYRRNKINPGIPWRSAVMTDLPLAPKGQRIKSAQMRDTICPDKSTETSLVGLASYDAGEGGIPPHRFDLFMRPEIK